MTWRHCRWLLQGAALASLSAACGHKADGGDATRTPVPVRVRTVVKSSDLSPARYSGEISPATQVDVAFRVSGYVQQILQVKDGDKTRNVQEGDVVKKSDVLAVVRPAELQQKFAAARASLEQEIASETQAQLDFDRTKALFERKGSTQSELDSVVIKLKTAHAKVAGARAEAAQASLAVDDTRLISPIDGIVLKRSVEIGSVASTTAAAFVVADMTSVKVVFGAPDVLAARLQIGGKLRLSVEVSPGEREGTVTRIAPSADSSARVFDVEARLPNPSGSLKSGMIASLTLLDDAPDAPALMLPLTAVIRSTHDPRGFAAYVLSGADDHAVVRVRDVKLGDVIGSEVVTLQGLALGERVVSQGASIVTDGATVRVVP